jgi:RNA polymerase sigma-70 factor (ECF subfamily)
MPALSPIEKQSSVDWTEPVRQAEVILSDAARHEEYVDADGDRAGPDLLVSALRRGDEAAFARLVDEWSPAMLRLARLHVSTRASAEEVVQETWLAVLRGLDRFGCRSRLRTWVFAILLNIAKRTGVREQRVVPLEDRAEDHVPTVDLARFQDASERYPGGWRQFPASWPTDPSERALTGELRAVIDRCVSELSHSQRAVLTLRDVLGCAAEEVCELLELSAVHQRVLLHRARAAVRRELETYFAGGVAAGGEET